LRSDVAEGVGENDRHHRQAPHQECSDILAKHHCHGVRPSQSYPGYANERASMLAVPTQAGFTITFSTFSGLPLHPRSRCQKLFGDGETRFAAAASGTLHSVEVKASPRACLKAKYFPNWSEIEPKKINGIALFFQLTRSAVRRNTR
jgi:hypothetical protein